VGVDGKAINSTQPPNGDADVTGEAALPTPPETSTDATIGRFRDAVQSIKETLPPNERPADSLIDSQPDSLTESVDRSEPPLKSVTAEQFVLVDSHGEHRATLSLDAGGGPALALADADGRTRAALRLGVDGAPSVVLYDTSGRRRLEVALKADGAAGLGLYDERGEGRAELVVAGSGTPSLSLYGHNGKRLAKLPINRER
jgi:hypothetical protein